VETPTLNVTNLVSRVEDLKTQLGDPPWGVPVLASDEMQAYLICQAPGYPNDTHYHQHDEWWFIVEGELSWTFEDDPAPRHVKAGDFVFAPKGRWHHIQPLGDKPSIRLAIGVRGEFHRYDKPGCQKLP
jgi:mannose-6-phosphate isomerase-like protein (cupin superfamily)